MPKIPKQRTGSGGWPDRRRVPAPSKSGGGGGCMVAGIALVGTGLVALGVAAYGAAEIVSRIA